MNHHLPSNALPKPPKNKTKPLDWLKENLFNSWFNTVLTIISLSLLYWLSQGLVKWLLFEAKWEVISANLRLFFIGSYPVSLIWRAWATLAVLIAGLGFSWGVLKQSQLYLNRKRWFVSLVAGIVIISILVPIGFYSLLLLWVGFGIFLTSIFLGTYFVKRFSKNKGLVFSAVAAVILRLFMVIKGRIVFNHCSLG